MTVSTPSRDDTAVELGFVGLLLGSGSSHSPEHAPARCSSRMAKP